MSTSLKLISLNIERSKHLDLVIPFLQKEKADVVCLQELMTYDVPRLEEALGTRCHFTAVTKHPAEEKPGAFGQGIFSRLPVADFSEHYYWGQPGELPDFDFTNAATKHASETHVVSLCEITNDSDTFRTATTHFTWTPHGSADDFQRQDMQELLKTLAKLDEFVLCGDFNAPRGGEIFAQLANRYKDNIPLVYKTSIDASLHRAGKDRPDELSDKMVDGLFTTSAYQASDVRLVSSVSDHMAIVATIAQSTEVG